MWKDRGSVYRVLFVVGLMLILMGVFNQYGWLKSIGDFISADGTCDRCSVGLFSWISIILGVLVSAYALLPDGMFDRLSRWSTRMNAVDVRFKRVMVAAILVVMALAFCLLTGYSYRTNNQSVEIPQYEIHAGEYRNDLLVQSKPYPTFFLDILSDLGILHSPWGMFAVFACCILLSFFGVYAVMHAVLGNRVLAIVGVCMLFLNPPLLAGVTFFDTLLLPTTVALPLLLFAIAFFLKDRYVPAFLLLGLAFDIHGMTALFVFCLFSLWIALRLVLSSKWGELRLFGLAYGVFLVAASPMVIRLLLEQGGALLAFNPQWASIMMMRHSHHTMPLTFPLVDWMSFCGLAMLSIFVCLVKHVEGPRQKLIVFQAGVLVLFATAIIAAQISFNAVVDMQPFRSSQFFVLCAIAGCMYLLVWFGSTWRLKERVLLSAVCIVLLFAVVNPGLVGRYASGLPEVGLSVGSDAVRTDFDRIAVWTDTHLNKTTDLVVVPPYELEFRRLSHVSIFGDYKDGSFAWGSPIYAAEWHSRMELLCGDAFKSCLGFSCLDVCRKNYGTLSKDDVLALKRIYNVTHIILEEPGTLGFPLVYRSGTYGLYVIDNGQHSLPAVP